MKANYLIIWLLFFLSSVLMAQPKKIEIETLKDYHLKGPVKRVVEDTKGILEFTPEGYLQFLGSLKEGKPEGITNVYDKAGHLLKKESYRNTYLYTYNAQGQIIKEQRLRDNECISNTSYLYDANGHARQATSICGTKYLLRNTYDAQKRLIKIEELVLPNHDLMSTTNITYLPNGWIRHAVSGNSTKIVKEYDNEGRERRSTMYDISSGKKKHECITNFDSKGNLIEYHGIFAINYYTYNAQGDLIARETISKQGIKSKITYTKHDSKGNWIESIKEEDGKKIISTRIIEYYE